MVTISMIGVISSQAPDGGVGAFVPRSLRRRSRDRMVGRWLRRESLKVRSFHRESGWSCELRVQYRRMDATCVSMCRETGTCDGVSFFEWPKLGATLSQGGVPTQGVGDSRSRQPYAGERMHGRLTAM
jgi:hypothetical protein